MPMVRGSVVRSTHDSRLPRRHQQPPSGLLRLLLGAVRIPLMLSAEDRGSRIEDREPSAIVDPRPSPLDPLQNPD